ncbi:hypothetical protein OBV_15740 [Oscillibacter valericigenes Sjm18-20]|nr:hypothetical protein OBV_15740 [Oscillibacter valericigenes Sjm18-20]
MAGRNTQLPLARMRRRTMSPVLRSRLTGLLSRRNTASHRCIFSCFRRGTRALPRLPFPAWPGAVSAISSPQSKIKAGA